MRRLGIFEGRIIGKNPILVAEDFLKEKAESGESLGYSIEGKIIELEASDVLLIYTKLSQGPEQWEIDYLKDLAKKGEDITYDFNNQEVSVPTNAVLELLDNINKPAGG